MYAAGLNVVVNTLYVICGDPGWQPPSISPRAGHRGFAWLNSCKLEASGVSPRPSDFFWQHTCRSNYCLDNDKARACFPNQNACGNTGALL